jgi:hypothetical protein
VYSLRDTSSLAADLVRCAAGGPLADVLLAALRLTPQDLEALDAAFDGGPARRAAAREVRQVCEDVPRAGTVLPELGRTLNASGAGLADVADAGAVLASTPLGGLVDLLRLVRGEVLAGAQRSGSEVSVVVPPHAVLAVVDAVSATYAAPLLHPATVACLRGPWASVVGEASMSMPAGDWLGQGSAALRDLLEVLARQGTPGLRALQAAVFDTGSDAASWASDMHLLTRAAATAGRSRAVAEVQLGAVRSIRLAGAHPALAGGSALRAVTGAVQAWATYEVGDPSALERLLAPWRSVHGG